MKIQSTVDMLEKAGLPKSLAISPAHIVGAKIYIHCPSSGDSRPETQRRGFHLWTIVNGFSIHDDSEGYICLNLASDFVAGLKGPNLWPIKILSLEWFSGILDRGPEWTLAVDLPEGKHRFYADQVKISLDI